MKIQNVKGGYDFLPKEQRIRNYINNILKEVFEEYGFNSIETPILCYYDMLADKYDENTNLVQKHIDKNKAFRSTCDKYVRSEDCRKDVPLPHRSCGKNQDSAHLRPGRTPSRWETPPNLLFLRHRRPSVFQLVFLPVSLSHPALSPRLPATAHPVLLF